MQEGRQCCPQHASNLTALTRRRSSDAVIWGLMDAVLGSLSAQHTLELLATAAARIKSASTGGFLNVSACRSPGLRCHSRTSGTVFADVSHVTHRSRAVLLPLGNFAAREFSVHHFTQF